MKLAAPSHASRDLHNFGLVIHAALPTADTGPGWHVCLDQQVFRIMIQKKLVFHLDRVLLVFTAVCAGCGLE
jgi:hypothetical protein